MEADKRQPFGVSKQRLRRLFGTGSCVGYSRMCVPVLRQVHTHDMQAGFVASRLLVQAYKVCKISRARQCVPMSFPIAHEHFPPRFNRFDHAPKVGVYDAHAIKRLRCVVNGHGIQLGLAEMVAPVTLVILSQHFKLP